ncbi:AraC family transcriptional regulator [Flagellimonas sp. HMM57]|uniref:helix-turn-helix domain-containing protein n=1 Tax=unclassified Flagellimonas TaxID=2644544 RepID=UPI0013D107A6|nr:MULTISPECIES: AraC family transcriptional regulator [unclassified Flagellimonas]UII77372.1 AraC family transcriptional regulator [Flagellimonas sp. HMM57]
MDEQQVVGLIALMLYLLIVIFPFLLLPIIFFKKNKELHDKVLIAWLSMSAVNSLIEILKIVEPSTSIPLLVDINKSFLFLNLFFFYAYGRSVLQEEFKWNRILTITLVPFTIWTLMGIGILGYMNVPQNEVFEYTAVTLEYPFLSSLVHALFLVGTLLISIGVFLEKRKIVKSDNNLIILVHTSNLQKILVILTSIYFLFAIWEYVISKLVENDDFELFLGTFLLSVVVILIFVLSFLFFRQKGVYKKRKAILELTEPIKQLASKIKILMEKNKPYLDADFSVSKLAVLSGESPQKVSEAIKASTNENFFSFVNKYRVEEAKNLFQNISYKDYTLVSIGLESGFNSKATFNRVFKNETGMTPSAYCNKVKSLKGY